MANCKTCENGILCPTWGDYKCTEKKMWVGSAEEQEGCATYKKRTTSEMPKCNCKDCSELCQEP